MQHENQNSAITLVSLPRKKDRKIFLKINKTSNEKEYKNEDDGDGSKKRGRFEKEEWRKRTRAKRGRVRCVRRKKKEVRVDGI